MEHFAWPLAVVIISMIAFYNFRPAIMRLIDRTSKAGKDGLTFERAQEWGSINPPTIPLLSFDDLMNQPISSSVIEREKNIKTNIQDFKLKTDAEKIEVLIRALAGSRLEIEFNRIAYIIFGSQLNLLVHLSSTTQGIPIDHAAIIFKQAQEKYPDIHTNRLLNDWLSYLISQSLIVQTNEKIEITQYGIDFLKHLVDARLTYERYG